MTMSETRKDIDNLQLIGATLVQSTPTVQGTATAIVAFTSLENHDLYRLRYCIKWSDATGTELLQVQVGATGTTPAPVIYPVIDEDGNTVTIGRLRRRELLCLEFISPISTVSPIVVPHFRIRSCLHPQCIRTPEITTA